MTFEEMYADSPQFIADVAEFLGCTAAEVEVSATVVDGLFEPNNFATPSQHAIIDRECSLTDYNSYWLGDLRFLQLFGIKFVVGSLNGQYLAAYKRVDLT